MATTSIGFDARDMSIGRVFQRAFGTIGDNPVATLGIAFLFSALPTALLTYVTQFNQRPLATASSFGAVIAVGLLSLLAMMVFAMLTQGAIVRATVAYGEGRRATFGESVMAGMSVIVPLFLLALVIGVTVSLAAMFFLIPGIILYVMWSVASPALVEERFGVSSALSRSSYLTKGARWRVFAVQAVMIVMIYLVSIAIGLIAVAVNGGLSGFGALGGHVWYIALAAIARTATSAVWATTQASLYIELRDWKDGPQSDMLAEVFA